MSLKEHKLYEIKLSESNTKLKTINKLNEIVNELKDIAVLIDVEHVK